MKQLVAVILIALVFSLLVASRTFSECHREARPGNPRMPTTAEVDLTVFE